MAPTFRHGKSGFLSITNVSAAVINYSSGINSVSFSRSLDTADVTHFGQNDKNFIPGLRGATISLSGMFSSTHAKQLDALLGSTVGGNFIYGPESTAVGRRKFSGSSVMTSLKYDTPVGDKVALSADFLITGAVLSTNF